ncbi:MAG: phosphoesterase [Pseudomonadota bacterium]|nr:phosphoesterase [Pseudomonadota bacterium]
MMKPISLAIAATLLLNPVLFAAEMADRDDRPAPMRAPVTLQPAGGPGDAALINDPAHEPNLSTAELTRLLRKQIKYVFVIFHENHSFDNEFGTFPGADGLYSDGQHPRSAANTPGFTQTYNDANGLTVTVQPFRLGPEQNSNVVDSVDHGHTGLAKKLNVLVTPAANGGAPTLQPRMNGFAQDEFTGKAGVAPAAGSAAYKKGAQFANLVMSHIDCDTVPFFWRWASNFTLFDKIFATEDTPSAPNALAVLSGQSGATQWVKHPSQTAVATADGHVGATTGSFLQDTQGALVGANNGAGLTLVNEASAASTTQGPPIVNDPQPYYGSPFDTTVSNGSTVRQPYGPYEYYAPANIASNLTYAALPLTLMGRDVTATTNLDLNHAFDLPDIQQDIAYIQGLGGKPVHWAWYQNGYAKEASDSAAGQSAATHWAYVSHHQGPQYFGYLANNPAINGQASVNGQAPVNHLKGETDFFTDIANRDLPEGGVFYIRGGYINQQGLKPQYQNARLNGSTTPTLAAAQATVAAAKNGDDDHPAYSDRQISEAMTARVINAIAGNEELWEHSAIVITYDESDGFYDHVPPRILSYGPDGLPLARGIRVPLLLVSPFARSHAVSHVEGDHNAVISTINAIFNLPALASLPDEAQALKDGNSPYFNQFAPAGFQQTHLGPNDIPSEISESLLSGFDPRRLLGESEPLPASYAMIDEKVVTTLPHAMSCSSLNLQPVAPAADRVVPKVLINTPAGTVQDDFNGLPSTLPALN